MTSPHPLCASCRYVLLDTYIPQACCEAFPKGIPGTILYGEIDHTKPMLGQKNKIVYKKTKKKVKNGKWVGKD